MSTISLNNSFTPGLAAVLLFVLMGCNGSSKPNTDPIEPPTDEVTNPTEPPKNPVTEPTPNPGQNPSPLPSGPPVKTGAPNASNQKPFFPQQTRAPEVNTKVNFNTTVITSSLQRPWGLTFLPDQRLLVTERTGSLRIVTQTGEISAPIKGVPAVDTKGQGGLLDVSLSPDFPTDRLVYLSYAEARGNSKTGTAVARGRLSDDETRLESLEVIFQQMPAWKSNNHFGSRLVWDSSGYLFVTLGERSSSEPRKLAQDTNTHLGKVLRLNADGSSPSDNPFVNGGGLPEIWSYGHRNVQGAAIHPDTDLIWTMEHGPRGGDELNQPEAGKNYGWPVVTYGVEYSGKPVGEGITSRADIEQPVYYFDPVIAPGGMTFYTGDMFPEWQGNLFLSSLSPGALVRIVLHDGLVVGEQRLLTNVGRVRDVAQGPDGSLWVVTDAGKGKLIKISL